MKKLVCVKDIESFSKLGEKVFCIDENTIITPSAKDAAKSYGITFSTEPVSVMCAQKTAPCSNAPAETQGGEKIDADLIYNVLKTLADKGMLQNFLESMSGKPYVFEKDSCGLKIVRGSTVKYEPLDTGNPADKVFYQEMINKDDGCSMNAGFITIEECQFAWECACEELYHIVEGTLTVTVNGKVYEAKPGDSVFFPNGAKVEFGSPNKMKAFYATY